MQERGYWCMDLRVLDLIIDLAVIGSYVFVLAISRIATTLQRDDETLVFVVDPKIKMLPCVLAALPGQDGVDPASAFLPSQGTPRMQLFFDNCSIPEG